MTMLIIILILAIFPIIISTHVYYTGIKIIRVLSQTNMRLTEGDIRERIRGRPFISLTLYLLTTLHIIRQSPPNYGVRIPSLASFSENMRECIRGSSYSPAQEDEGMSLMSTLTIYEFPTYNI